MLTPTQVRAHVRLYFDLDATDLPDALVDSWTLDAFRRIIRSSSNWPHLETVGSLAIVAGTFSYTKPMETVNLIQASSNMLTWIPESEIARRRSGGTSSGNPLFFTIFGDQIQLWPTPRIAETAVVYGSRAPTTSWYTTPTSVIDLPDDYEGPLLSWVLCETAKQQNDFSAAGGFASDFTVKLAEINSAFHGSPNAVPLVVNGGSRYRPKYDYVFDVDTSGLR